MLSSPLECGDVLRGANRLTKSAATMTKTRRFMDKENKWHNVSFDSATYSICKVMAGAKGQSTASYMRDLVLLALHGEYADQLRVIQRKLKACVHKTDSRLTQ